MTLSLAIRYNDANGMKNGQDHRKDTPLNLNGLLEDLDVDHKDVFGNPVDGFKAAQVETQEDEIDEEKLLKELDESDEVNRALDLILFGGGRVSSFKNLFIDVILLSIANQGLSSFEPVPGTGNFFGVFPMFRGVPEH